MANSIDFSNVKDMINLHADSDVASGNYTADFPSVRDQVSSEEWKARVELAACYRLVDRYGMSDLTYNHITNRIPGTDEFLINLYGLLYKEITASSLAKVDLDGNILWKPEGTDYGVNAAGYLIHSAVHQARPDVHGVIHTHSRGGMAVGAMRDGLLPLGQHGIRFMGHISYHDYEGPALSETERAVLQSDLGDNNAMILRNHGLLTAGPTLPEAFNLLYQLEMACRMQVDALACGPHNTVQPSQEVIDLTAHVFAPGTIRRYGLLEWPAMLRLLEAESHASPFPYYAN